MATISAATLAYATVNDWHGVGRTLVSQGILYGLNRDLTESIEAYQMSLLLLREDLWYARYFALQGLGIARIYQGDIEAAFEQLELALGTLESRPAPPSLKTSGLWLRGEILLSKGQRSAAARDFRSVLETYLAERMSAPDVALISLRLAKVYYLDGELGQLREICRQMLSLLEPVEKTSRLLGVCFGEFLRLASRGELTGEILEKTYRVMRKGAKVAPPLLPLR